MQSIIIRTGPPSYQSWGCGENPPRSQETRPWDPAKVGGIISIGEMCP